MLNGKKRSHGILFWLVVLKGGELFLATSEVRMNYGRASPASFQDSGMLKPSKILRILGFPCFAFLPSARATLPVAT